MSSEIPRDPDALAMVQKRAYHHTSKKTDVSQHLPFVAETLRRASSYVEVGVRSAECTHGAIWGLATANDRTKRRSYTGIDITLKPLKWSRAWTEEAAKCGVDVTFIEADSLKVTPPVTDVMFIDGLHVYRQVLEELNRFADNVAWRILLHDTVTFGDVSEFTKAGVGKLTRMQEEFKKSHGWSKTDLSVGIAHAVDTFLRTHDEWERLDAWTHCNGLTVLQRKGVTR
jgi:hypothetical protein